MYERDHASALVVGDVVEGEGGREDLRVECGAKVRGGRGNLRQVKWGEVGREDLRVRCGAKERRGREDLRDGSGG